MKKISQREALRLKKRVAELEAVESRRLSAWHGDYPGGVNMGKITYTDTSWILAKLFAAAQLKHVIIAKPSSCMKEVNFYAVPMVKS